MSIKHIESFLCIPNAVYRGIVQVQLKAQTTLLRFVVDLLSTTSAATRRTDALVLLITSPMTCQDIVDVQLVVQQIHNT